MLRLIVFLLATVALATGLSWLADRPGLIVVNWEGYEVEITVFHAVVAVAVLLGFAVFAWSLLRQIWLSPAALGGYFNKRRQKRGLEALSSATSAMGAGVRTGPTCYGIQARKWLPHEPLTQLLRAQAAQLSGDRATARRIYEGMLAAPDTEVLGLRGLFLEAQHEGEKEAARQFAERAVRLNPSLGWPVEALFDLQCRDADWAGALETLAIARKHGHVEKASADRRRRRSAPRTTIPSGRWLSRSRPTGSPTISCLPPPSPVASCPPAATRPRPPRYCSGRGCARRIPISPRRMPMPGSATARMIVSIGSSSSRRSRPT